MSDQPSKFEQQQWEAINNDADLINGLTAQLNAKGIKLIDVPAEAAQSTTLQSLHKLASGRSADAPSAYEQGILALYEVGCFDRNVSQVFQSRRD